MNSTGSDATNSGRQPIKSAGPLIELNERLGNAVNELYQLLEHYAPAWYTEELHAKAEATLLAMGKLSAPVGRTQSQARLCRNRCK